MIFGHILTIHLFIQKNIGQIGIKRQTFQPHILGTWTLEIPRFGEGCESKKSKIPGKARAWHAHARGRVDVRGSQTLFARHNKHGLGYLDKLDSRPNREVVPIVLDSRQNDNGDTHFCNIDISTSTTSKEKTALFCWFFTLCPHIDPYISRKTMALSLCSNR